ncbi:TaqI-like C-terminal specificity domain-containing protein [uncultured Victivallis sp.]|uniref:TaqI-like C-terminal specificity domain-containing protein n=1 Tax=uncultured Victivallis sp. TaxID=354118 RepID=UPI0025E0B01C|nr:TaqI-like C-terminal specificity domain-containing protein [uncultured Victivallis sp.]
MAEAQAIAAVRVSEAARRLDVSAGTIRNWLRTGLLTPLPGRPVAIAADAVEKLRHELGSGSSMKLRSRANKRRASVAFAPSEYSSDRTFSRRLAAVAAFARSRRLNVEKVLCFAALRLLAERKEVELSSALAPLFWRRRNMERIMAPWLRRVGPPGAAHCRVFELAEPGAEGDFLGYLYQSLSRTGLKSAQGSYYTPDRLVEASLRPAAGRVSSFLDPCCGTGNYLVHAARVLQLPLESIHGVDLDPVAARIARLNLLLEFPEKDVAPDVRSGNALGRIRLPQVDFIATNPPWGAFRGAPPRGEEFAGLAGRERFSFFIARALSRLPEGGRLSMILPESILNIRAHADIRSLIAARSRIERIEPLGRPFSGVFTATIRLDLVRRGAGTLTGGAVWHPVAEEDRTLLEKIFAVPHRTLKGNALWALGIVTGDNRRFLADAPEPGAEPILRGSDIQPFSIGAPRRFLRLGIGKFQQAAPLAFYRTPGKLIYRFIADRPVFALDRAGVLTLNSANLLIPRLSGVTAEAIVALFNSTLFGYLFRRRFATHKVLRGDLEELPVPEAEPAVFARLGELADSAGNLPEIDRIVFDLFHLTAEERARVLSSR